MMKRRRLVFLGIVVAVFVLLGTALVLAPVIIRHQFESRVARMTGRTASVADIDLNVFTGRMSVSRLRLSQKGSNDPALEFERLELRVALNSLFGDNIRVREIILTAPTLHVTRQTIYRFDFSDLLDLIPPPDPKAPPSKKTVSIERVLLTRGTVVARDESVTPAVDVRIEGLEVDGTDISTRPNDRPGRLSVSMKANGTPLTLVADTVEVPKSAVTARLKIDDLDV